PSGPSTTGSLHAPLTCRRTTISLISSADRSRYATTGPADVTAAAVRQQSHASSSTSPCAANVPSGRMRANRRLVPTGGPSGSKWPDSNCSAIRRPSSHTTPTSPSHGNQDTKPCSLNVPSRFSSMPSPNVAPPSSDSANTMSYDPTLPAAMRSQCAAQRFEATGATPGKSAQLTSRSSPLAIVRGVPNASSSSTANLSAVTPASGSSQLSTTSPPGPTARCAPLLSVAAGTASSAGSAFA